MAVPTVRLQKVNKTVKLGRKPPRAGKMLTLITPHLDLGAIAPTLPASVDYSQKAAKSLSRMYVNDQLGDCVIAGEAHLIGVRSANDEGEVVFDDKDIVRTYHDLCGPGDDGCVITDVLDAQVQGRFAGGHQLAGYCAVDSANKDMVKACIYLFGTLTLGINLPSDWANNAEPNFVWDKSRSGSVGGHEVVCCGYNDKGVITSTWGMLGVITWAALGDKKVVDECYTHVGREWTGKDATAPNGLKLDALLADLKQVQGGTVPDVNPPPTPPPPGPPPGPSTGNVLTLATALAAGSYLIGAGQETPEVAAVRSQVEALGFDWKAFLAVLMQLLALLKQHQKLLTRPGAIPWAQILALILQILQGLGK